MGSRSIPKAFTKPVRFKISVATKNGNNDGKTTYNHKFIPFRAEDTAVFENRIRIIIKIIQAKGTRAFFK